MLHCDLRGSLGAENYHLTCVFLPLLSQQMLPVFFHGALRPQKPYGLLGTVEGEGGMRTRAGPPPTSESVSSELCTTSLSKHGAYFHRNHKAY